MSDKLKHERKRTGLCDVRENAGRTVSDDPDILAMILADWHNGGTYEELTGDLIDIYNSFSHSLLERTLQKNIGMSIRGITAVNGCDLSPIQRTLATISQDETVQDIVGSVSETLHFIERNPGTKVLPYELSLDDLNLSAFRVCELYGQLHQAPSIREIDMSESHYPDYLFTVDGKNYSYLFLYYYINYVYCSRFVDFSKISNVIEIGPGAGRQVEVIKKFHPHLNFYLIDLGPTLYLCHQYLSAIFPDDVLNYESTRDSESVCLEDTGQIVFVGNWNFDRLAPSGTSLFISSGTLSLMKPKTASRYLENISEYSDYIFMIESRTDDSIETYSLDGSACLEDFHSLLDNQFHLLDREAAFYPLGVKEGFGGFEMMIWVKSQ